MNTSDILKLNQIGKKVKAVLSASDRSFLASFLSSWLGVTPEVPEVPVGPKTLPLVGYLHGASSVYTGKYYFSPPNSIAGDISSVTIGSTPYAYGQVFNGRKFWFGEPASGNIIVKLKDGSTYSSTDVISGPPEVTGVREQGDHKGFTNGRPYWYWTKNMRDYPDEFYMVIPGMNKRFLVKNNGKRLEVEGYFGWIIKQSDVKGRNKMAMLGPPGNQTKLAYVEY